MKRQYFNFIETRQLVSSENQWSTQIQHAFALFEEPGTNPV